MTVRGAGGHTGRRAADPRAWLSGANQRDPEKVQLFGFTALFPVTFLSAVFVPIDTMPGWLQPVVKANPVTILSDAARGLMFEGPVARLVLLSLIWAVTIAALFAPLSVRALRRRA